MITAATEAVIEIADQARSSSTFHPRVKQSRRIDLHHSIPRYHRRGRLPLIPRTRPSSSARFHSARSYFSSPGTFAAAASVFPCRRGVSRNSAPSKLPRRPRVVLYLAGHIFSRASHDTRIALSPRNHVPHVSRGPAAFPPAEVHGAASVCASARFCTASRSRVARIGLL